MWAEPPPQPEVQESRRVAAEELAGAVERFMQLMDALENPRPAASWFALGDALRAYREALDGY
jgi:alkylation response protein AidB-like acyl-CoA dehydrogenase